MLLADSQPRSSTVMSVGNWAAAFVMVGQDGQARLLLSLEWDDCAWQALLGTLERTIRLDLLLICPETGNGFPGVGMTAKGELRWWRGGCVA